VDGCCVDYDKKVCMTMLAKIENDYRETWFKTVINRGSDTNWHCISGNSLVTLDFVLGKSNYPWRWETLSRNKNITLEMIIAHPELQWSWNDISWGNPNVTSEFVVLHPELPWNWSYISERIPITFILQHPELPWDWATISRNSTITFDFVLQHPEKPWSYHEICNNRTLQLDFIVSHPEKNWSYNNLGKNPFTTDFENHVNFHAKNTILLSMHEYYTENPYDVETHFERIIFEQYLLKKVLRY
jgi:hypothetical protein